MKIVIMLAVLIVSVSLLDMRITRRWATQDEINRVRQLDTSNLVEQMRFLQESALIAARNANTLADNHAFLATNVLDLWKMDEVLLRWMTNHQRAEITIQMPSLISTNCFFDATNILETNLWQRPTQEDLEEMKRAQRARRFERVL